MKTTMLYALCSLAATVQLNGMNICLMERDTHVQEQTAPTKAPKLSADAQMLDKALQQLNFLARNKSNIPCLTSYEEQLKTIEMLASSSQELSVQRNANFVLGIYRYNGYGSRTKGINYKKALAHFTLVTGHITLNPTTEQQQQQAEAYFFMGKIHQQGASCLFGCYQTVKVDFEKAETCFFLAHEHAEHNPDFQKIIQQEAATLRLPDTE